MNVDMHSLSLLWLRQNIGISSILNDWPFSYMISLELLGYFFAPTGYRILSIESQWLNINPPPHSKACF